ncbi:hypothetical protein AAG747_01625 [Rapidithrix thailandica]|uniref:Transposase n=1 Tax=Rapidithrix thailandica TaxID=413964 RepID=A0AAW9S072_9BACT
MEKDLRTKIYKLARSLQVIKHKKSQESLVSLVFGLIASRSVVFSELADKMDRTTH